MLPIVLQHHPPTLAILSTDCRKLMLYRTYHILLQSDSLNCINFATNVNLFYDILNLAAKLNVISLETSTSMAMPILLLLEDCTTRTWKSFWLMIFFTPTSLYSLLYFCECYIVCLSCLFSVNGFVIVIIG